MKNSATGNKNMILLLTASIAPKQFKNSIERNDVKTRLEDYKKALKFWLHHKDANITEIIFAENSGYDLTEIKQIFELENSYNRKYHLIQKEETPAPEGFHYGYSELELLDYVFEKYPFASTEDYFIKVTGRLYFPELSKLILVTIPHYLFVADSRIYNFFGLQNKHILTTVFICRVDFYQKYIFNQKGKMKDLTHSLFETLLVELLYEKVQHALLRFPFNLNPIGIGAHSNKNYGSLKNTLMNTIRATFRKIAPNFWI
ncbi:MULTISPECIES: hypothetical protein [Flavobacterium]|uniref:hypothetical protein n=1 Tax=Flavobacterium TaxID=237 RepID=UPI001C7D7F26|nr:hypothetical protein [Flavobacterium sp. UMI-01]GIZ10043.1 hypothetical protein FUMI01_27690 [Flavobacterium sp. UMI-01]